MNTQQSTSTPTTDSRRDQFIAGVALISIGALVLAGRFVDIGLLLLPVLAGIFLVWGVTTRNVGLIIPGGIIGGIGTAALLIDGVVSSADDDARGMIFFLSFACGWALITLLSALFTEETHWWPLIPGGIMAGIALLVLAKGIAPAAVSSAANFIRPVLDLASSFWPIALIAFGLYVLARPRSR